MKTIYEVKTMTKQPTEVVIVGAGYAGLLATVRLARKLRGQPATITLVNASEVFVERLLLHQFAAGTRSSGARRRGSSRAPEFAWS